MNRFVIALGMFDGLHLGHRVLLQRTVDIARAAGDISVVYTFSNHPRELFGEHFRYVSTLEQREVLFRSFGINRLEVVPFTVDFARQLPHAFLEKLSSQFNHAVSGIVCGYDYRFGRKASGDVELLGTMGDEFHYSLEVIQPVLYRGIPVSSTRVRDCIADGNILKANEMLCRPYMLSGTVVHNKAYGRSIGFPTANIVSETQIVPKDGVYATALFYQGEVYPSVTNIGWNPTVRGENRTIETHVPNVQLDLYGKDISILFLDRIREETVFDSVDSMVARIGMDTETALKIYQDHEKSVYKFVSLW